ncbi:MAG: hypothetical protein Q8R06_02700, partial [Polaromonas sp.]|nr:hypothetical protein [Polaromonas sp.]
RGLMALQWHDGAFELLPETQARLHTPTSDAFETVDWLVCMRRLPGDRMLDQLIAQGRVAPEDIDPLVAVLGAFYRSAPAVALSPDDYLARFQYEQAANREVLLRPQLQLPDAALAIDRLDLALAQGADLLRERACGQRVLDGHGDLRPEHVCLLQPPVVIDCLEFNPQLRQADPFAEHAYLGMECEVAGAAWTGQRLVSGCATALGDGPPPALRRLSTIAKPTGRYRACSSDSRQDCARFTPPGSGEATASGPSPASLGTRASKTRCASRCRVVQRKAFWKAATLWASSTISCAVPTASNSCAT